jgi:hypothetical protein
MLGTLRDALDADCAIMAGGNIRADKNYEGEQVCHCLYDKTCITLTLMVSYCSSSRTLI